MFNHCLSLERDGHTLEALRLANELVEEEGLNLYHAAHLHMKMARFLEVGVYHATKAVKILTQLKGTDESIADELQEAWQVLLEGKPSRRTGRSIRILCKRYTASGFLTTMNYRLRHFRTDASLPPQLLPGVPLNKRH